jgi:hypothetical protein
VFEFESIVIACICVGVCGSWLGRLAPALVVDLVAGLLAGTGGLAGTGRFSHFSMIIVVAVRPIEKSRTTFTSPLEFSSQIRASCRSLVVIHDSIPVCCVQHQAFRRKIRHIIVSDPARYGLCYGLTHCFHLKTLTVHVGKVDGVFLEKNLMSPQANRGGAQTQGQEAEIGDRAGRAAKVNCRGHG